MNPTKQKKRLAVTIEDECVFVGAMQVCITNMWYNGISSISWPDIVHICTTSPICATYEDTRLICDGLEQLHHHIPESWKCVQEPHGIFLPYRTLITDEGDDMMYRISFNTQGSMIIRMVRAHTCASDQDARMIVFAPPPPHVET